MEGGPPVQVVELHQGGRQGDALVEVSLLHVGDSSLRPPAGGEISDIPNLSLSLPAGGDPPSLQEVLRRKSGQQSLTPPHRSDL